MPLKRHRQASERTAFPRRTVTRATAYAILLCLFQWPQPCVPHPHSRPPRVIPAVDTVLPLAGCTEPGGRYLYLTDSLWREELRTPHLVYYIPGANVGHRGDTNLFTRSFCLHMRQIMGDRFRVLNCNRRPYSIGNVMWALWYGQRPMRHPEHNRRISRAVKMLFSDGDFQQSRLAIISSSYGTVVAAQLAVYLASGSGIPGWKSRPFDVVFGSSMLSFDSELYRSLLRLRSDGRIGRVVYERLQYPGDNVTGMCSTSRLKAFGEAVRISCPFGRPYKGQPSIFNSDPVAGHIHRIREGSDEYAHDYVRASLIENELAGPWYKVRACINLTNHP